MAGSRRPDPESERASVARALVVFGAERGSERKGERENDEEEASREEEWKEGRKEERCGMNDGGAAASDIVCGAAMT